MNDEITEKMIQHDVTEQKPAIINTEPIPIDEIDKIPRDTDDFQKIVIKLNLPYFLLKEFSNNIKKRFGDDGPTLNGYMEGKIMEWNKENELLYHVGSLSFGSSFPRIDVLHRLYSIAIEFETWPEFPKFKRSHLEAILKKIIGHKDPRTFRKYLDCIVSFVEAKNGGRISFYGDYDVTGFRKAIEEALNQN